MARTAHVGSVAAGNKIDDTSINQWGFNIGTRAWTGSNVSISSTGVRTVTLTAASLKSGYNDMQLITSFTSGHGSFVPRGLMYDQVNIVNRSNTTLSGTPVVYTRIWQDGSVWGNQSRVTENSTTIQAAQFNGIKLEFGTYTITAAAQSIVGGTSKVFACSGNSAGYAPLGIAAMASGHKWFSITAANVDDGKVTVCNTNLDHNYSGAPTITVLGYKFTYSTSNNIARVTKDTDIITASRFNNTRLAVENWNRSGTFAASARTDLVKATMTGSLSSGYSELLGLRGYNTNNDALLPRSVYGDHIEAVNAVGNIGAVTGYVYRLQYNFN